jgi:hypothetical protein
MRKLFVIVALGISTSANATIAGFNEFVASFTNSALAVNNVTWSEPDKVVISTNGLGWDGQTNESRDFWIQSIPVAIGTSWRPAQGANVSIEIAPQIKPKIISIGQSNIVYVPYGGSVFVRYSPDKKHWSSWQSLEEQRDPGTNRVFHGSIEVPRIEQKKYFELFTEYSALDVDWKSDEEAAVKWILQREPDFFEKQLPFVGYVQFRMEGSLSGGQRIEKIRMQLGWAVGGLHSIPKNPEVEKNRHGEWRFQAP